VFPPSLVNDAVTGGIDRRAERRAPVDAGMGLHDVEQRMIALAKSGAENTLRKRLAHQKLLRALSRLIVVIDDTVIRCLVAIEFLGFAPDGDRCEHDFVL